MVIMAELEKAGYSDEKLKKLFTSDTPSDKIKELKENQSRRIDDEVCRNLAQAPVYEAIDHAWDIGRTSMTYHLVNRLLEEGYGATAVLEAMDKVGDTRKLREMLIPFTDEDGNIKNDPDGKPIMRFDVPIFLQVFIPLVKSYVTSRWAKLWDVRNQFPLLKYSPVRLTRKNQLICAILDSIVERMTTDMGYRADIRAAIQQTLKYGFCRMFPEEAWYIDEQLDSDGKKRRVKEGVRFALPHPVRSFMDMASRSTAANFGTGPQYGGFWTMRRWGDVRKDKQFWNLDKVNYGYSDDMSSRYLRWNVFRQCELKFPRISSGTPRDRLDQAFRYTDTNDDEGVTLVSYFCRIIPKDYGMYDYEYPVWHRFVYVGPDTIAHVEPLPYDPMVAFLYDHDINTAAPNSFAMELMPWQDQLGNLINQYLLSIRANLNRVVYVNADMITPDVMAKVRLAGERALRGTTYVPYSSREQSWAQNENRSPFQTYSFTPHNTQEISAAISTLIATMERVMGIASLEVGAAATHEQSAHEVETLASGVNVRQRLTSSHIGDAIYKMKVLLYEGFMQYAKDDIVADIDPSIMSEEELREVVQAMGLEIEEENGTHIRIGVKGKKKNLEMDSFASEREGEDRLQDSKVASSMIQMFQAFFSNPMLVEAVGIEELIHLFNSVLHYAGVPLDFRIQVRPQGKQKADAAASAEAGEGQEQAADPQAELRQELQIVSQLIDAKLKQYTEQVVAPLAQQTGQIAQQSQAAMQQLAQGVALMSQKVMQLGQVAAAGAQKDQVQDAALKLVVSRLQQLAAALASPNAVIQPPVARFGGGPPGAPAIIPGPGILGPLAAAQPPPAPAPDQGFQQRY